MVTPTGLYQHNAFNDLQKKLGTIWSADFRSFPFALPSYFRGDIVLNLGKLSPTPNIALSYLFNMIRGIAQKSVITWYFGRYRVGIETKKVKLDMQAIIKYPIQKFFLVIGLKKELWKWKNISTLP